MKQALVEGAVPIPGISMYEQGQGKLDLARSKVGLLSFKRTIKTASTRLDYNIDKSLPSQWARWKLDNEAV